MTRIIHPSEISRMIGDHERRLAVLERHNPLDNGAVQAGAVRVSDGSLDRVVLGKQDDGTYGLNLFDAGGNKIFDALGLVAVIKSLGITGQSGSQSTSSTSYAVLTGTPKTIVLARPENLLCLFLAVGAQTGGAGNGLIRCNTSDLGGSGGMNFGATTNSTCMAWFYIAAAPAGSHTIQLELAVDSGGTSFTSFGSNLQIFQLGA